VNASEHDFNLKNPRAKIYWPEKKREEKLLSMSGKSAQVCSHLRDLKGGREMIW
jgi:hypothetical protein